MNKNESISTSNSTATNNSTLIVNQDLIAADINGNVDISGIHLFLYYDFNNIPFNIRLSYAEEDETGMYIGAGFKFGKSSTISGIYQLENGQAVLYDGDALIGSFGPKLEESRSIYSVNIGVNRHLFWNIWWSG